MPPKVKITREMILHTVLQITRERGFEGVNARSIAENLNCSTRPIFTCYENMEELKKEFLDYAFAFYEDYIKAWSSVNTFRPPLLLPLSYIRFAREESRLFEILFIRYMDLDMTRAEDFYREIGNEKKAENFGAQIGVERERAKAIFFDLFLYSHGIAVLTAAGKVALKREECEGMLSHMLDALTAAERRTGREG